jgi:hypothetical protein
MKRDLFGRLSSRGTLHEGIWIDSVLNHGIEH